MLQSYRIRSGLLLFVSVCVLGELFFLTSLPRKLAAASPPVLWTVLAVATICVVLGWAFWNSDQALRPQWRKYLSLASAGLTSLSTVVTVLYFVPMELVAKFHLHGVMLPWIRAGLPLILLGVLGSLYCVGRSRIAFLTSGAILWALWGSLNLR